MVGIHVHVRWMIRRDHAEVLRIEEVSFSHPWTEEDFLHCLRDRKTISMVAQINGYVRAYMVYELHRYHLNLLNFAVDPAYRRQGVGQQMILHLKAKLSPYRRTWLSVKVRETNLDAQLFFRDQGFKAVGLLRGYYEVREGEEDAVLMQYHLTGDTNHD